MDDRWWGSDHFFYDGRVRRGDAEKGPNLRPSGLQSNWRGPDARVFLKYLNRARAEGGGDPSPKMISPDYAYDYDLGEWWGRTSIVLEGLDVEVWRGRLYGELAVADRNDMKCARAEWALWTPKRPHNDVASR